MDKNKKPGKRFSFDNQRVIVDLPASPRRLKAVSLPIEGLDAGIQRVDGEFEPIRTVINIAVVDEDDPKKFIEKFAEPFQLRVRYSNEDLHAAQSRGRELRLGYWDGKNWKRFKKVKHKFAIQPDDDPKTGGYGVVQISDWGDPPVAWGV